jgi:kynurenine formamidase
MVSFSRRGLSLFVASMSAVALLGACGSSGGAAAGADGTALEAMGFTKVIDLAHVIDTTIPIWPGDPTPEFKTLASIDKEGYYLRSFMIGEHSATHMNSGNSFFAGGNTIDSYEPASLVKRAVVIDVQEQAKANADYVVTQADIEAWEKEHGEVPADSVVLVHTGWQEKWNDPKAFLNIDAEDKLHFPGIGGDTAAWLLAERKIAGVGIDTHGVDPGLDSNYGTNNAVLQAKGIVLECLTNLDELPATGTTLVLGPLRLKDGSGTPLSVMAFTK